MLIPPNRSCSHDWPQIKMQSSAKSESAGRGRGGFERSLGPDCSAFMKERERVESRHSVKIKDIICTKGSNEKCEQREVKCKNVS